MAATASGLQVASTLQTPTKLGATRLPTTCTAPAAGPPPLSARRGQKPQLAPDHPVQWDGPGCLQTPRPPAPGKGRTTPRRRAPGRRLPAPHRAQERPPGGRGGLRLLPALSAAPGAPQHCAPAVEPHKAAGASPRVTAVLSGHPLLAKNRKPRGSRRYLLVTPACRPSLPGGRFHVLLGRSAWAPRERCRRPAFGRLWTDGYWKTAAEATVKILFLRGGPEEALEGRNQGPAEEEAPPSLETRPWGACRPGERELARLAWGGGGQAPRVPANGGDVRPSDKQTHGFLRLCPCEPRIGGRPPRSPCGTQGPEAAEGEVFRSCWMSSTRRTSSRGGRMCSLL